MKSSKETLIFDTALYIRLSREDGDKEESDSIRNQRKLLTDHIADKEEIFLYDIYVDDGYSGTDFKRPEFLRMIADIEAGKVNCVIVKDLSRFGRDYIETGRYLERYFPRMGVRFISVADGIDSSRQAYDILLPIKNIFNEQYARDISGKIQATLKSKQKAGEFIGAFASYGYKKSPVHKNQLIVDEYAACIVKRIFSLYVQGMAKQQIARLLNKEGIACPTEYKRLNGENYQNGNCPAVPCWSYATVHHILKNEMYLGNMVQGKKHQSMRGRQHFVPQEKWVRVRDTHEAIIDPDTWEKVQKLLLEKQRDGAVQSQKNIFTGLIKCGDCGRNMVRNGWERADGSRGYSFCCGTYKRNGRDYCSPHRISQEQLKEIVLEDLKRVIQSVSNLRELIDGSCLVRKKERQDREENFRRISLQLERIKKLQKSIYEDYKENLLSKEEFLSYRLDYRKKEQCYFKQMEALESPKQHGSDDILEIAWIKYLLKQKDVKELDREIVVEMIDHIAVYQDDSLKICYNFSKPPNFTARTSRRSY